MKMSYLQGNKYNSNSKKSFSKVQFIGLLVLFIICVLLYVFASKSLISVVQNVRAYVVNGSNEPRFIPRNLAEQALVKSLQTENEYLRSLLGKTPEDSNMILAGVIERPPRTPFDSLVIDIGSDQDILEGDMVFSDSVYAIGMISSVSGHTSTVTLFSSAGQKIDALINSPIEGVKDDSGVGTSTVKSRVKDALNPVVAEGQGAGNFYIKLPKNIKVKVGDPVVWPSAETILLGAVEVVESGEGEAYSQLRFKSPINMNSLRYVQVKKVL
jgi:cell shape-determining protein MreC